MRKNAFWRLIGIVLSFFSLKSNCFIKFPHPRDGLWNDAGHYPDEIFAFISVFFVPVRSLPLGIVVKFCIFYPRITKMTRCPREKWSLCNLWEKMPDKQPWTRYATRSPPVEMATWQLAATFYYHLITKMARFAAEKSYYKSCEKKSSFCKIRENRLKISTLLNKTKPPFITAGFVAIGLVLLA